MITSDRCRSIARDQNCVHTCKKGERYRDVLASVDTIAVHVWTEEEQDVSRRDELFFEFYFFFRFVKNFDILT